MKYFVHVTLRMILKYQSNSLNFTFCSSSVLPLKDISYGWIQKTHVSDIFYFFTSYLLRTNTIPLFHWKIGKNFSYQNLPRDCSMRMIIQIYPFIWFLRDEKKKFKKKLPNTICFVPDHSRERRKNNLVVGAKVTQPKNRRMKYWRFERKFFNQYLVHSFFDWVLPSNFLHVVQNLLRSTSYLIHNFKIPID